MKRRVFVTLFLSAVLALPSLAQQEGANSAAQPAAQTSSGSQSVDTEAVREPLQPVKSTGFWDGDEPNVVNLILHPFATEAYVRRQVAPIRDRINELDQINAGDAATIKDGDARSQRGLQMASEKVTLADQHSADAASHAQLAQTAATQASARVSSEQQIVGKLDQYKGGAQTEIHFRPGQTVLSKQAKEALDQLAAPLKDQHGYIIEVQAFAPGRGHAGIAASQKMADSVTRYLVLNHQIPMYRIYTVGMGSAPVAEGTASKHVRGGRVEVNLLKNDVVSSAQR
jgi:outer membrane protein OmpA-like peptidoglycan-associated protein